MRAFIEAAGGFWPALGGSLLCALWLGACIALPLVGALLFETPPQ